MAMSIEEAISAFKAANKSERGRLGTIIKDRAFRSMGKQSPREARALQQKMYDAGLKRNPPAQPSNLQ